MLKALPGSGSDKIMVKKGPCSLSEYTLTISYSPPMVTKIHNYLYDDRITLKVIKTKTFSSGTIAFYYEPHQKN
jgi:hypothetical protein